MALNLAWRTLKDFLSGKGFRIALLDFGNGNYAGLHGLVDTTGAVVNPASAETMALIATDVAELLAQAPVGGAVDLQSTQTIPGAKTFSAMTVAAPAGASAFIHNISDGGLIGFVRASWNALFLGFFNSSAAQIGAVGAGNVNVYLAADATGRVGSVTNSRAAGGADTAPAYRNLLDDGSGNALFQGSVTVGLPPFGDSSNRAPTTAWVRRVKNPLYFYGYVGDGGSHPISGVAVCGGLNTAGWSLAQWQSLVPQITALTNEIDGVAMQAVINAYQTVPLYGVVLDLPPNTNPQVSFTLYCGGNLNILGNRSVVTWAGTGGPVIVLGSAATRVAGEILFRDLYVDCRNQGSAFVAWFQSIVGAGSGAAVRMYNCTFFNVLGDGMVLYDAPRSIDLMQVTVWAASYQAANQGFRFVCSSIPVGAQSGNAAEISTGSFSYTLIGCQTSNFQYGFSWEIVADTSPEAYSGAGGKLEGIVVHSCRAYNGQGFARVTNSYNGGSSFNYGSPLWTFRDCDYQCSGNFLDLSGITDVLIDNCWIKFGAGASAKYDLINLTFCTNVVVRNCTFGIASNANGAAISCCTTDVYTSGVKFVDNTICADVQFTTICHWAATAVAGGSYTNIEKGTFFERANQGVSACLDDGGNQVSEQRVLRLGGRLAPDVRRTQFLVDAVCNVANGQVTVQLPAGLFRAANPRVLGLQVADYGQFAYSVVGVRNDFAGTGSIIAILSAGAPNGTCILSGLVEGN